MRLKAHPGNYGFYLFLIKCVTRSLNNFLISKLHICQYNFNTFYITKQYFIIKNQQNLFIIPLSFYISKV